VVSTWTMCSIANGDRALGELRRVLKPGGNLLFVAHGCAPGRVARWCQDRLTPMWRHVAGGCRLNRAIPDMIARAGFKIERMEANYMAGRHPISLLTFMYEGSAQPY